MTRHDDKRNALTAIECALPHPDDATMPRDRIADAIDALESALDFHNVRFRSREESGPVWTVDRDRDGEVWLSLWNASRGRLVDDGATESYGPLNADQAVAVAQRLVCFAKYGTSEEIEEAVAWAHAGGRAVHLDPEVKS